MEGASSVVALVVGWLLWRAFFRKQARAEARMGPEAARRQDRAFWRLLGLLLLVPVVFGLIWSLVESVR